MTFESVEMRMLFVGRIVPCKEWWRNSLMFLIGREDKPDGRKDELARIPLSLQTAKNIYVRMVATVVPGIFLMVPIVVVVPAMV
jgi:hypothetical protein